MSTRQRTPKGVVMRWDERESMIVLDGGRLWGGDLPHGISWSCGHTCGTHPPIYSFTMLVCCLHMKLWNPGSLQACLQLRPVPLWYQNNHTRRACSTSKDPEVKTRHPGSIMGALLGLETAAILRRVSWMPPSQQAHSYQLRAFDALAKWCVRKFFIWKMTFCEFLLITRSALQPKERNRGLSLRPVHSNTHLAHRWDIPSAATYWLHVVTGASGLGIRVFCPLTPFVSWLYFVSIIRSTWKYADETVNWDNGVVPEFHQPIPSFSVPGSFIFLLGAQDLFTNLKVQVCRFDSTSRQPNWHTDATFRERPPTGSALYFRWAMIHRTGMVLFHLLRILGTYSRC